MLILCACACCSNPLLFALQPQATVGPPTGQSGDQDLVPIGIGVALGVVVVLVILFAVVAVVVVQRKRKRKGVYDAKLSQGNGITNALYTGS